MHLSHLALALLVVLVWGFNFVVIKVGLEGVPPLLLCFARFFLTSIPAIFFVKFPSASVKMIILYGLIMFALQFALLFMGMYAGVAPGIASLLLQVHVFFTGLLAVLFLDEKLNRWQGIGALLSFSGIGLIGMNITGHVTATGFFLVVGAAMSWSVGNLLSKKIGKVNMIALVVWGSLIAWPPLLAISCFLEGPDRLISTLAHISWTSIGSILYITYLSTLFGFGIWSWLLHQYRLPTIAPFTMLVPIVALLSSALVLGEPLESWKVVAAILVIAGVCTNLLGPRFFAKKGR